MIKIVSFEQAKEVWSRYLWPSRVSPIESNSAMNFLNGYDMRSMYTTPTFFAYVQDDKIIGVNSGHMCGDNSYRSRGLYVSTEYRNQGIGVKLLLETISQAKKESANFIWSYPRQTSWNTYQKAGFMLASDWEISETSDSNAYCRLDL